MEKDDGYEDLQASQTIFKGIDKKVSPVRLD